MIKNLFLDCGTNLGQGLREFEKNHIFDEEFIRNARLVYITNDKRARIKKEINEKYKSEYQEVKYYA